jgi:enoyl-[acyl-carrier protein] reductase I
MLNIDLSGKRAFVAGIADDAGFGFAIAKQLAEAGAEVCAGTWPPAYGIFTKLLARERMRESLALSDGRELHFERIYAMDALYDTLDQAPAEVRENRRYKAHADFSIDGVARQLTDEFGPNPVDIVVHSIANAPEVQNALLETSRAGYLSAISQSSYSFVALVQRFAPLLRPGGSFLTLSFAASERAVPGYGGGMSSAKAALESDTRILAWEVGRRHGARVNCISAGALASRAASAVGFIDHLIAYGEKNAPLPEAIEADEVGKAAAFLCSPLASGITGTVLYVDKGIHAMGVAVDWFDGRGDG